MTYSLSHPNQFWDLLDASRGARSLQGLCFAADRRFLQVPCFAADVC
jgi:hypothetical protein